MSYLLLAIASSAMVSVCMRLAEKHVRNQMAMFMANYAVCILLSLLFLDRSGMVLESGAVVVLLALGVISGVLYLVSFMLLKLNMRHNGIVLASTFMKLGVLIPTVMAVLVFHETPTWLQLLGIVSAVIAIVMIHFEKDALHDGSKKLWLLVLLVLSGFTDAMANIYEQLGDPAGKDWYLVVTFVVAFLLALVFSLTGRKKISGKDLLYGMLIGVPNYFSARFLLLALGSVDAVIAYPMYSVATMITIAVIGVAAFHEKVSRKKAFALGLIVLALCLLNI